MLLVPVLQPSVTASSGFGAQTSTTPTSRLQNSPKKWLPSSYSVSFLASSPDPPPPSPKSVSLCFATGLVVQELEVRSCDYCSGASEGCRGRFSTLCPGRCSLLGGRRAPKLLTGADHLYTTHSSQDPTGTHHQVSVVPTLTQAQALACRDSLPQWPTLPTIANYHAQAHTIQLKHTKRGYPSHTITPIQLEMIHNRKHTFTAKVRFTKEN